MRTYLFKILIDIRLSRDRISKKILKVNKLIKRREKYV